MQKIDSTALDNVAANILGCSVEMVPFFAMSWDSRNATEITKTNGGTGKAKRASEKKIVNDSRPHPIVKVSPLPKAKLEEMREKDKQTRLEELKAKYQAEGVKDKQGNIIGGFEIEPADYVNFATNLAKAFREQTGELPVFLLDEDTMFQVECEGAKINNLRDLL